MKKEFNAKATTVDLATEQALILAKNELGTTPFSYDIQVIETPKKKLFGGYKGDAVVKLIATYEEPVEVEEQKSLTKLDVALSYIDEILKNMNLKTVTYTVEQTGETVKITLDGDEIGVLIGHHGETLDALQYLVALSCNRIEGDYFRITIDGGNYRKKREETLKQLAIKISEKVKRTGRSQMLEPMNPYERRLIHAVISEIEGVFSKSKGEDPNRRIIILSERPSRAPYNKGGRGDGFSKNRNNDGERRTQPYQRRSDKPTVEQLLKKDNRATKTEFNDNAVDAKLYSKIDI